MFLGDTSQGTRSSCPSEPKCENLKSLYLAFRGEFEGHHTEVRALTRVKLRFKVCLLALPKLKTTQHWWSTWVPFTNLERRIWKSAIKEPLHNAKRISRDSQGKKENQGQLSTNERDVARPGIQRRKMRIKMTFWLAPSHYLSPQGGEC